MFSALSGLCGIVGCVASTTAAQPTLLTTPHSSDLAGAGPVVAFVNNVPLAGAPGLTISIMLACDTLVTHVQIGMAVLTNRSNACGWQTGTSAWHPLVLVFALECTCVYSLVGRCQVHSGTHSWPMAQYKSSDGAQGVGVWALQRTVVVTLLCAGVLPVCYTRRLSRHAVRGEWDTVVSWHLGGDIGVLHQRAQGV